MALGATVYHFEIDLSDVDRGVYEVLDLRLACHPSETLEYLVTRALAYCLFYEDGIAFSRGLSTADEPAVWVKDALGGVKLWLDVGSPSADRLHRASKGSNRVAVVTHHDPSMLLKNLSDQRIHRAGELEIVALEPRFVGSLVAAVDRHTRFALVRNEDELYATIEGASLSGKLTRHRLAAER